MKIRNGFVSNSSSSSFLVAFQTLPKTVEELKEMLFKGEILMSFNNNDFTDKAAECIFEEMKEGTATLEEAEEAVCYGVYPGCSFDYPDCDWETKAGRKEIDEFHDNQKRNGREVARKFVEEHKDSHIFVFEYADDEGELFSTLEHCGTFDNLPHIKSSYH